MIDLLLLVVLLVVLFVVPSSQSFGLSPEPCGGGRRRRGGRRRASLPSRTASSSKNCLAWVTTLLQASASSDNKSNGDSSTRGSETSAPSSLSTSSVAKPFGRQEYWESFYNKSGNHENDTATPHDDAPQDFSWYSSWDEMEPFVMEWQPPAPDTTVLVPGIGSDASLLVSLHAAGYTGALAAFDYAPSSIDYCVQQLAAKNVDDDNLHVDWAVADATQPLPYSTACMDLILDKGTLDAIFIAGGGGGSSNSSSSDDKKKTNHMLHQAVTQLQNVLKPGGIFWSLSGICTAELRALDAWKDWDVCADSTEGLVMTADGYTSNNLDGDLLVWRKPTE